MTWITTFINSWKYLGTFPITVGVFCILFLMGERRRAGFFLKMTACTYGLCCFLKEYIRCPRPYMIHPEILKGITLHEMTNPYRSFPSGHTAVATVMFVTLFLWYKDQTPYAYGFLIPPLMVTFSRIYIGAHWITDCIGGALVAIAVLYFFGRRDYSGGFDL